MTELMQILYDYASRYRLAGSMEDCKQYEESAKTMERNLEALQEGLTREEMQKLENYIGEQKLVHDIELESMFCAGFAIGQELSRL